MANGEWGSRGQQRGAYRRGEKRNRQDAKHAKVNIYNDLEALL
jgi:hypothetical protein